MLIPSLNNDREGMTLPLGGPAVDQWHLLECHFGLPLFDASLNQQVSQKIISHQLFSSERYEFSGFVKKKRLSYAIAFMNIEICISMNDSIFIFYFHIFIYFFKYQ